MLVLNYLIYYCAQNDFVLTYIWYLNQIFSCVLKMTVFFANLFSYRTLIIILEISKKKLNENQTEMTLIKLQEIIENESFHTRQILSNTLVNIWLTLSEKTVGSYMTTNVTNHMAFKTIVICCHYLLLISLHNHKNINDFKQNFVWFIIIC